MKFADVRYINGFAVIISGNQPEMVGGVSEIAMPKIQMFAGAERKKLCKQNII